MPFKSKKQERYFQAGGSRDEPRKGGLTQAAAAKFIEHSKGHAKGGRIPRRGFPSLYELQRHFYMTHPTYPTIPGTEGFDKAQRNFPPEDVLKKHYAQTYDQREYRFTPDQQRAIMDRLKRGESTSDLAREYGTTVGRMDYYNNRVKGSNEALNDLSRRLGQPDSSQDIQSVLEAIELIRKPPTRKAGGGRIGGSGLESLTGRSPRTPGSRTGSTLGSTGRVGAIGAGTYAGKGLAAKRTRPGAALSGKAPGRVAGTPSNLRPRPGRGVNPRLALSGTVYHEAQDRLDRLRKQVSTSSGKPRPRT